MTAELVEAELPADLIGAVAETRDDIVRPADRAFWKALGLAALLHASLFIGVLGQSANQKRLGEEDGAEDAINVSMVTEADFLSRSTVPAKSDAGPGPPAPPVEPPPQQPVPELKQTLPAEEPAPPAEPPPPDVPKAEPPKETAAPADKAAPTEKDVPDLFKLPDPAAAKNEPAKSAAPTKPAAKPPAKPQQQKQAKLDLSPPKPTFDAPPGGAGRSAGFSRPPGITRSGANDDFARGVIRALQQTMPQLGQTLGRVTVKIVLNENGNVKEVQVVRPSPDGNLNQSVVFAARQTSYPFPPNNSNEADRIFLVTYIYN